MDRLSKNQYLKKQNRKKFSSRYNLSFFVQLAEIGMKKFFVLSLMVLAMICFVSCGSSDDSKEEKEGNKKESKEENKEGGNGNSTVVDENILEVPADQDNTAGALCDPKTFVESCDGNAYIDCYEDWVDDETLAYIVHRTECDMSSNIILRTTADPLREVNRGFERLLIMLFPPSKYPLKSVTFP